MNLWIRSQDRYNLVKINNVSIDYSCKNKIIANYIPTTDGDFYEWLGCYETEERALEVLDEIEAIIIATVNIRCVYEMPKE